MATNLSPLSVKPTRSELMSWYNRARSAARRGKLDIERVNRAFGWLEKKAPHIYETTIKSCSCPDHHNKPAIACKHMIGIMILSRIVEKREADKVKETKIIKPAITTVLVGVQYSKKSYIRYEFKNQDEYKSWLDHNGFSPDQFTDLSKLHGHVDKNFKMFDWEVYYPWKAKSIFQP